MKNFRLAGPFRLKTQPAQTDIDSLFITQPSVQMVGFRYPGSNNKPWGIKNILPFPLATTRKVACKTKCIN